MAPSALAQAARIIRQGGIIAYPTEAVYGLGCDPFNQQAVFRLLQVKQRDPSMGLILIGRSLADFDGCIDTQNLPEQTLQKVLDSWPGPVTWLLPANPACPAWLTGKHNSIAVRVTAQEQVRALCQEAGMPLVSTSANRSGASPCRTAGEVRQQLGDLIDFVLPGETGGHDRPTEIRDALTGRQIRA